MEKITRQKKGKEILYNENLDLDKILCTIKVLEQDLEAFDKFCKKSSTDRTKLIRYFVHTIANLYETNCEKEAAGDKNV